MVIITASSSDVDFTTTDHQEHPHAGTLGYFPSLTNFRIQSNYFSRFFCFFRVIRLPRYSAHRRERLSRTLPLFPTPFRHLPHRSPSIPLTFIPVNIHIHAPLYPTSALRSPLSQPVLGCSEAELDIFILVRPCLSPNYQIINHHPLPN
jgi:hypothetical protein